MDKKTAILATVTLHPLWLLGFKGCH